MNHYSKSTALDVIHTVNTKGTGTSSSGNSPHFMEPGVQYGVENARHTFPYRKPGDGVTTP